MRRKNEIRRFEKIPEIRNALTISPQKRIIIVAMRRRKKRIFFHKGSVSKKTRKTVRGTAQKITKISKTTSMDP